MLRRGRKDVPAPAAESPIATSERQAVVPGGGSASVSKRIPGWEVIALALVIGVALFLRFGRWDLLEFKADQAIAMQLALGFVREGHFPLVGLMSGVGVANPPLFIYLLIPLVAVSPHLSFITSFIAATGTAAVVVCWHVGRRYYSPAVGLISAALFAVSFWAVIYSRNIWAQDFVPIFATLTMWALHAVILGGNRRAIFWVVFLPLCVIQIHFSGLALTAAVGCILLLLRPKFDWRFAVGGAAAALVLMAPYLDYQATNGWVAFSQAATALGGDPRFNPDDLFNDPYSGYPLPNHHDLTHALGVVNGGEIGDTLGLSEPDFEESLSFENWALGLQQFICGSGVIYLMAVGIRGFLRPKKFPASAGGEEETKTAWILTCWVIVPILAYCAVDLATVLSYFVISYPAPCLICAVAWRKLWMKAGAAVPARVLLCGALGFILAGNLFFTLKFYGFVARHGGTHGGYGTVVSYKQEAATYLAENADVGQLLSERRLVQMDQYGRIGPPQPDIPVLASLVPSIPADSTIAPNTIVVIVDRNRASFTPEQWARLASLSKQEFGPIQLYFVPRPDVEK